MRPSRSFARAVIGSALLLGIVLLPFGCASTAKITYPQARVGDVVEDYHGTQVADPYRWMEEPYPYKQDMRNWIEAENKVTFDYLNKIPERDQIRERLTELWNYEKYGIPYKKGNRYFFEKNDGLQNQNVLYTVTSLNDTPRILLDPNKLSDDGTVALANSSISDDGNRMAYALSASGSDWREVKVRDVETGEDLNDHLKWVKFSGLSWAKDGSGFYYSRYDEPKKGNQFQDTNYYQKLYFHRVGEPQSSDTLVYKRDDQKEWGFSGQVTDDGNYLIISVWKGTEQKNLVFYKDLTDPGSSIVELIPEFEAEYTFVDNNDTKFLFQTDLDAPRGRIIGIDIRHPDRYRWSTVVEEARDTLRSTNVVGNTIVCSYLHDAHTRVKMHALTGSAASELKLPGLGSAYGFYGKRGDMETFYSYTSFTDPGTIYRYDFTNGKSSVFRKPKVAFDSDNYETEQVFYYSKDGTRVPMFITHKKGLKRTGDTPTLLYGYGGFNIPITPGFSVSRATWLEMGGIYAVANIRGGGEYGKAWHDAGKLLEKQNVFDDFIGAAEWLIDNNYTCSKKLAIQGGSNGGLLIGAVETQRPDLFGCCLPAVGVMDMLRFQKFTIGWAWASDYGSSDNPEQFAALYAYSPYHNLKPGTHYPPTLITTADHDDRVVPAHSFKFAARLQADQAGDAPTLIRIQTKAGHGAGKPTSMRIEEATDILGFIVKSLNMKINL